MAPTYSIQREDPRTKQALDNLDHGIDMILGAIGMLNASADDGIAKQIEELKGEIEDLKRRIALKDDELRSLSNTRHEFLDLLSLNTSKYENLKSHIKNVTKLQAELADETQLPLKDESKLARGTPVSRFTKSEVTYAAVPAARRSVSGDDSSYATSSYATTSVAMPPPSTTSYVTAQQPQPQPQQRFVPASGPPPTTTPPAASTSAPSFPPNRADPVMNAADDDGESIDAISFYKQMKQILNPEQFVEFANNIRALNNGQQSVDVTVSKVLALIGPDRPFLKAKFKKLVSQNVDGAPRLTQ